MQQSTTFATWGRNLAAAVAIALGVLLPATLNAAENATVTPGQNAGSQSGLRTITPGSSQPALTVSSVVAGTIAPNEGSAGTPNTAATQVPVKLRSPDYPRFRGPFPILSTPYTDSGAVDFEVLARSARFVDWCESPGMIWPQSNDSIDLLTRDEKLEGMETLAGTARGLKTTALCLGVQGKDTDDMLVYARRAKRLASTAVISRPPDTGKTKDDLRQYWRALAEIITDRPVMIQTHGRRGAAHAQVGDLGRRRASSQARRCRR